MGTKNFVSQTQCKWEGSLGDIKINIIDFTVIQIRQVWQNGRGGQPIQLSYQSEGNIGGIITTRVPNPVVSRYNGQSVYSYTGYESVTMTTSNFYQVLTDK